MSFSRRFREALNYVLDKVGIHDVQIRRSDNMLYVGVLVVTGHFGVALLSLAFLIYCWNDLDE